MRQSSIPRAIRWRLVGAFALGTLAAAGTTMGARLRSHAPTSGDGLTWTATPWNLPLDNWGLGRAWHASGTDGTTIRLFARTKTGFCNCFSGIADDAEIDRIGDVDLHGDNFAPTAPGRVTAIGDLPGRERSFQARSRWSGNRHVVSIVAAADCKAVVATLVSDRPISPAAEASAVALLTADSFRYWAANQ